MGRIEEFDELDRRIISLLSTSSEGSFRHHAKELGIHPTTLIQRVRNLESKGVIDGYRAKIDYMRIGFEHMGMVQIYIENDPESVFDAIRRMSQVVAVFEVTGECDAIAWIACKEREEFSAVVKSILALDGVRKTNTSVVLDMVKDPFSFVPDVM